MPKIFKTPRLFLKGPWTARGFSLVEMLVYVGLMAFVLVSTVGMLLSLARAYNYLKLSHQIQGSAADSLDRMVRDIRNARSINLSQSTLGTNPGVLALDTTSDTGSLQALQFYVSSGALHEKRDGADLGPLTLSGVTVDSLIFRQMSTGISQAVKIEMTLTVGSGSAFRSANFYDTALLRDSY